MVVDKEKERLRHKLYYIKNKDKELTRGKLWREKNKEKESLRHKIYRNKNREKRLLQEKLYRSTHQEQIKQYRDVHKQEKKDYDKIYNLKNKEKRNAYCREWNKIHREELIQNYNNNKDFFHAQHKQWRLKNKEKRNKYWKDKYHNDINFRITHNLRRRINQVLHGEIKSDTTAKLTGCSINFLKSYLEKKWQLGMSWDNYEFNGWHIDHIKPCSSFNMNDPEEQRKCFHYTNLQPLWAEDNLIKSDKIW